MDVIQASLLHALFVQPMPLLRHRLKQEEGDSLMHSNRRITHPAPKTLPLDLAALLVDSLSLDCDDDESRYGLEVVEEYDDEERFDA